MIIVELPYREWKHLDKLCNVFMRNEETSYINFHEYMVTVNMRPPYDTRHNWYVAVIYNVDCAADDLYEAEKDIEKGTEDRKAMKRFRKLISSEKMRHHQSMIERARTAEWLNNKGERWLSDEKTKTALKALGL